VIGTGFGCRVHVPALRRAGFDVVALVGRDADRTARRAARADVPHACSSLGEVVALEAVDAVTIATPPDTHAELAIAACAAGLHVICEKPFALDAAEAARMLDAATRAGVTHLVGHEFRWAPDHALVARALCDGLIGDPRTFSSVQYVPLVADPAAHVPHWWFDADRGGGWLGASGSHLIDQVRTWFGEVKAVSATLPMVSARTGSAEDSFVVRLTTETGVEGIVQQTAASWTPSVLGLTVVAGTTGTLEVRDGAVFLSNGDGRRALPVPEDLALDPAVDAADDPRERFTHLELGPYTRLCEALIAGVRGDTYPSPVPVPTFADGLAEMQVLDAIRVSATNGGALVAVG
jgi:predicted dehydrogenase